MMINRINSVTVGIPVADLNRAIDWYRQLLGKLEEMSPAQGVWEARVTSSFWLQLFEQKSDESSLKTVGFETGNIEISRKLALSLDVEAGKIETVPETVRYFEFRDPFGNFLSFYELLDKNAG